MFQFCSEEIKKCPINTDKILNYGIEVVKFSDMGHEDILCICSTALNLEDLLTKILSVLVVKVLQILCRKIISSADFMSNH